MITIYMGVLGLMGLAMGSFVNVVAWRVPQGKSIVYPPSACPHCGIRIWARDNLPIIGYLLLAGKCRSCGVRISPRYPIVEIACGILWAAVGYKLAWLQQGFWSNIGIGLVWLFFVTSALATILTDLDFLIILDKVSLGGLLMALVAAPLFPFLHHAHTPEKFSQYHTVLAALLPHAPGWLWSFVSACLGAAAGLGVSMAIHAIGNQAFSKHIAAAKNHDPEIDCALGLGDVKLMGFYGALFGWLSVVIIFAAASILGSVSGIILKLATGDPEGKSGWEGMKTRWHSSSSIIPFGPFLVAAALGWFFWEDAITTWL